MSEVDQQKSIEERDQELLDNPVDNLDSIIRLNRQEVTPVIVITSQSMEAANSQMLHFICSAGRKLDFGDEKEHKYAWEAHVTLQLSGKILEDCYMGKTPSHFPMGPQGVLAYQREYFNLLKCLTFIYHYKIRLEDYRGVNQMDYLKEGVRKSIQYKLNNNRLVATLWDPFLDEGTQSVPCFNWCQLRRLTGNVFRLEILYRSWDVTAVWSNLAGLIKYFVDEVIVPGGGVLGEVIITGTSTHVYRHDFDYAKAIVGEVNSRRLR